MGWVVCCSDLLVKKRHAQFEVATVADELIKSFYITPPQIFSEVITHNEHFGFLVIRRALLEQCLQQPVVYPAVLLNRRHVYFIPALLIFYRRTNKHDFIINTAPLMAKVLDRLRCLATPLPPHVACHVRAIPDYPRVEVLLLRLRARHRRHDFLPLLL